MEECKGKRKSNTRKGAYTTRGTINDGEFYCCCLVIGCMNLQVRIVRNYRLDQEGYCKWRKLLLLVKILELSKGHLNYSSADILINGGCSCWGATIAIDKLVLSEFKKVYCIAEKI
jgi:hypothetical protein